MTAGTPCVVPRILRAPAVKDIGHPALFLAGGITDCPDWQSDAISLFHGVAVTLINPRRAAPPGRGFEAAAEQIAWESRYLARADVVLFWFAGGRAVQPISLYELGKIGAGRKPMAVGADPAYSRRDDVVLQLSHARPRLAVHSGLAQTVAAAISLLPAAGS